MRRQLVETPRFRLTLRRGYDPPLHSRRTIPCCSPCPRRTAVLAACCRPCSPLSCSAAAATTTSSSLDEQVKAAWSEVLNQYQRRADLIPNLVTTVKGEANFEQETLTKVIEARSRATSIQATPELVNDPAAFQKFQAAQGELTGALSRLMVVAEQYPQPEGEPGFPGPARAARRHREPHHRRAQPLHQDGGRLQRAGAQLPDQPDRDDVRLQGQAELHGAERSADLGAAAGGLRQARRRKSSAGSRCAAS